MTLSVLLIERYELQIVFAKQATLWLIHNNL